MANRRYAVVVVPAALLTLWFVATQAGWVAPYQFPSPVAVVRELGAMAASGELAKDVGASIERVALGFAIGGGLACVLGTLTGLSRMAEAALDPTLQAIRAVPSLAWVPLLLLWLGIGETAKITLVAIGAFFPVYVNLVSGIRNVDRKLIEVAAIFGVKGVRRAIRVVLPAASPALLVGLRIGMTQAWLFLVAAELIASTKGLGFLLTEGQQIARIDRIIVAILLLALCGKLSESLMLRVERAALHWTDGLRPA